MAKMFKQRTKLTLVAAFGKGADKPLRKTRILIVFGLIMSLFMGYLLSNPLTQLDIAKDIPDNVIFVVAAATFFVFNSFLMLPLTQKIDSRQSIYSKNLRLLPLSRFARWYVIFLPITVVGTITCLFFLPILVVLSDQLNTNFIFLIVAYLLSLNAAIGLSLVNFMPPSLKFSGFIVLSAGQFFLIDKLITSSNKIEINLFITLITASLILCSFGIVQRYFNSSYKNQRNKSFLSSINIPAVALKNQWYSLKVLRNKKTIISFLFCAFVSYSLTGFIFAKHQYYITDQSLIVFAGILCASLACDFRGISRPVKTPEILALKNFTYFVNSQVKSGLLASSIIITPLVLCLVKLKSLSSLGSWLYLISIIFAATMIGLLSSAIFVPESGEVGSQFFSALSALSILFGVPKVLKFSALTTIFQSIAWLCLAGICCLTILLIENRRLKNYGHI